MTDIRLEIGSFAQSLIRFQHTWEVFRYWQDNLKSSEAAELPKFDPIDVPKLLSHVYLLENISNRLRYRVSGEEVNRLFGSNHTGKFLDDVVPERIYPHVADYYLAVFESKVCVFKGHVLLPRREFLEFERVLLPIERNGTVQLLGTLALSTSSQLRDAQTIPPPPKEGFHFHLFDLKSGQSETHHDPITPEVLAQSTLSEGLVSTRAGA